MGYRLVGVGLLLGVGLLAGCSSDSSGSAENVAAAPYEAEDSQAGGQGEKAEEQEITQPGVDRVLVRTATIELAAGDVGDTVDRAREVAVTEGGYAGREEVREDAATLTLHIPSDRFDRAVGELSELGKVISRDQAAEDVTEQLVDLDSRLATQRASVDRVRALLARASTVDEIVRIEQELTTRESDLESLEQRRQALGGQVAMSTVTVRIGKSGAVAREEKSGFLGGLADGWGAFLDAGGVALRVIGAVLPFLVVLAVPAVPVVRWWRRRRPTSTVAQQP